ncbi:zinc-binding dehydrogenase [Komagataeibacter rhaeticus]|nr:zinc-binding dehydrogenase [Komagataeibacter rhaeticus]
MNVILDMIGGVSGWQPACAGNRGAAGHHCPAGRGEGGRGQPGAHHDAPAGGDRHHAAPRDAAYKAEIARQLEDHVWPLLGRRAIRPLIHATFPFARVADAHKLMENGTHMGKIMLDLQHPPTDTIR